MGGEAGPGRLYRRNHRGVSRLHRIGLPRDVLTWETWKKSGLPIATTNPVKPPELYAKMEQGDARSSSMCGCRSEWMGVRIGTVVNLPLNHLSELSSKLDPAQPVVTVCNSAYRSSMAIRRPGSRKGFTQVSSLAGEVKPGSKAGLPVYGAETSSGLAVGAEARDPYRGTHRPH